MSNYNETDARELDLYAENTSELYGQFKSIIANLQRTKSLRMHLAKERAEQEYRNILHGEYGKV